MFEIENLQQQQQQKKEQEKPRQSNKKKVVIYWKSCMQVKQNYLEETIKLKF
jgi:hypothetical protein